MAKVGQWVPLVPVRNMNRAIKFYSKVLGAKVVYRGQGTMKDFWASVKIAGTDIWFVSPEEREKRKLAYNLILVKNIRSTVAKMQKKGVKFQRAERASKETKVEGPIAFEPFGASAFFTDSEGNAMMVWQNFPPM